MGKYNKESLEKLLILIDEICKDKENFWFKEALSNRRNFKNPIKYDVAEPESDGDDSISRIYEYCIKDIVTKQANKFYEDFKIDHIKQKLIDDFIRMEHFRREDNFEDFCLAMFQQLEGTVNSLISVELQSYIIENKTLNTHMVKDKNSGVYVQNVLWQLLFYPSDLSPIDLEKKINKTIFEWDFSEKFKVVLFYYYFNKRIYNFHDFQSIYFLGNDLYQSRNLNHRGGKTTENQKKIINKVTSDSQKYYFKFLGFLEDFLSTINKNI